MMLRLPAIAMPYSAGITPLTICTSPTDSMLTTSILLMPLYCESWREPALPLASVPLAVMLIDEPPRPFNRSRTAPLPPSIASCLVRPAPTARMFEMLRFAVGRFLTSSGSMLMRCSGDKALTSGDSPLTVMFSSMPPTSS